MLGFDVTIWIQRDSYWVINWPLCGLLDGLKIGVLASGLRYRARTLEAFFQGPLGNGAGETALRSYALLWVPSQMACGSRFKGCPEFY